MITEDKDKDKLISDTDGDEVLKEVPEVERKAREAGHRTKDEWVAEGKDPDAWVSAEEFMRRAPLFEGLHKANRTIKSLEKKLNLLAQHQEEMINAKVQQRLDGLKAEKKRAAQERDVEKMVEIDEEIEKVKEESAKKKEAVADNSKVTLEEWKEENPWYEDDEDMFAYANGIGSKLEKDHPDWSFDKILGEVAKRTKKAFEHKTKNPNREQPGKVASSRGAASSSSDAGVGGKRLPTYSDLPPEAQAMYREFVKTDKNPHGIMTKEKYLRDYALKAGLIQEAE